MNKSRQDARIAKSSSIVWKKARFPWRPCEKNTTIVGAY
jgi:hypothetical protein